MTSTLLDLPRIRYLIVVHEVYLRGSIGAAARAVNLSQPAATQSVSKVENTLNTQLFKRTSSGLVPTDEGALFRNRLERILSHLRRGERLARARLGKSLTSQTRKVFHKDCSPVQLRSLLAVAESGSFSLAAQALGVSQPGIHRATRELAALSGIQLFDQTRGGVILSPSAEAFAQQVRLAISEFRQAKYEIDEVLGREATRINVGSLPLSRASFLPEAIDAMLAETGPRAQINCVDARYPALLKDLQFGNLDVLIGALRFPKPAAEIEQEELFVDELSVIVPPNHPLANQTGVSLADTLRFPWIAPPKDTPSGTYLFDHLRIHDLPDTPVRVISSSLVLLKGLFAQGEYVSIASKRQIRADEQSGHLVKLPIDLPGSKRAIGLTFRSGWRPTPIQERFLEILRAKAKDA